MTQVSLEARIIRGTLCVVGGVMGTKVFTKSLEENWGCTSIYGLLVRIFNPYLLMGITHNHLNTIA